jgi:hypothetical protein
VVIQRGERAQRLLGNDAFAWIVDDMTTYNLAALVAAPPGPRGLDAREHHHLIQFALSDIVATLQGYAAAGEAMQRVLTDYPDTDNEDDL